MTYAPKEDLLNVINFSNWTYFNSEKISTKVYDVEISASLYEQLLPSEYKKRTIKEDEVVCIQYRKSVLSEEQDQFLIEKFNKNNFMLLQQKEIQIDVELKNKIKSICNSYIEPQNNNSYTAEILDKIRAAGIEVVTDKDEFDRILQQKEKLQRMVDSVESIESLFNTNNNENLNSDIDSVTPNDINVKFTQINISQTTPFIFKECGLDEYPVNIYKQKLARAFFLEKEKFGERRTHGHKGEFTSQEVKEVFENFGNPRYIFNSRYNISNPADFYLIGVYDTFDLNGEPMMVSLHFNKNEKEVEANWITSVYGKNKNILVDDWTKKGYLIYKNDLEIEKAPEEVVTLYMRVSKSSSAYEHNILLKSNIVNDMGIMYMKENNNTYGFVHNGKIYLNSELMNSNAAVHEYTHLWDAYTRKTNPELWNKGLKLFKDTKYWNEVINDPNYQDIKNDENLVLSEIHSRICGNIAEKVLERIAELDGEQVKLDTIDWDEETWKYITEEMGFQQFNNVFHRYPYINPELEIRTSNLKDFLSTPMKDLMSEKKISVNIVLDNEKSTIKNNNEKSKERHSDAKDYLIQTTRLFLSKLKEKNLPFLKGKEQGSIIIIKPQVVRDAATGKSFTGYTQLMAQALIQALYDQKKLPELEYDLITYDQAKACGTFIKKGSSHITLTNYNRTTNSASKQMYYFKSGCNSPEMIDLHKESIARNRAIKRIRLSLEEKEIPSERQTEEKNKITLLHYEEMTYLKALNKDTEQYFDSLPAEEKNMLTELCKKTPLTQKTVKELAETLRKDRLISTQLSLQKNSERYFDATECIVPEDFIAKAMAAASLGCSLETTEKTIDSITKDLHQTLSKNIDHYDYGKAFEVGEVITEKCIKNCKEMKNQEYEAAELAKKLEQKQQELKKNPINLLMELLNKNDLSNRTIGGYER